VCVCLCVSVRVCLCVSVCVSVCVRAFTCVSAWNHVVDQFVSLSSYPCHLPKFCGNCGENAA
jgi:hypothetical protein